MRGGIRRASPAMTEKRYSMVEVLKSKIFLFSQCRSRVRRVPMWNVLDKSAEGLMPAAASPVPMPTVNEAASEPQVALASERRVCVGEGGVHVVRFGPNRKR